RRSPLRGAGSLPSSDPARGPLCQLGPEPRTLSGPTHRQCALPALPPEQSAKHQRLAAGPGIPPGKNPPPPPPPRPPPPPLRSPPNSRPTLVCRPPISLRMSGPKRTATHHDQEAPRPLWPQVEPFCSRRSRRGAPYHPAHPLLLLAGRAARRRGRLCPHHPCAPNGKVRELAHPSRAARRPARPPPWRALPSPRRKPLPPPPTPPA